MDTVDRYRGCLLGLAVGDAVGTTLEFKAPGTFSPISDMVGGGPFHLKPGEWTDDTSIKTRNPPEIRGTGYVVQSLEAALWAFHRTENFRDGCLAAVNLGDDADTTGAVFGQIAGAFYGYPGIPEAWRTRVSHNDLIDSFGRRLCGLSSLST